MSQLRLFTLLCILTFFAGGCFELLRNDNYSVSHMVETADYDYQTTTQLENHTVTQTENNIHTTTTSDDDTTSTTWCFSVFGDCVMDGLE